MTDSLSTCPDCGATLPPDSPQALCPACLMRQALASRTIVDGDHPAPASPPLTPEELGEKFPGYEILQCLGRGGMGVVYKARQKSLNRIVAIKILAPERGGETRFAERFAREAELLARLNHPHIVTIHDFGETGGLFYLVMEFVDGVNLRDLLRDGKLEPGQALAIVPPICDALQYAHDKGIVHRDIKPENLLLDRDGRIKIADFGIASLMGAAGEIAGTPPYMAPEQNGRSADHRADIYALGVVLYEMLTGERPEKELIAPSRKVQIDVRLDEVVLRALEQDPERRYQTAGEFKTLVETMKPAPAVNPPAPARPPGMFRRWWRILLLMIPGGMILGLSAGAVVSYLTPKKYEASTVIELKPAPGSSLGVESEFFRSFQAELKSDANLRRVSQQLDLPKRWALKEHEVLGTLPHIVGVQNIRGTLIEIRVKHTDPQDAVDVANVIGATPAAGIPFQTVLHMPARHPGAPVSPNVPLVLAIGAGGGLLLSPVFALVCMLVLHRLFPWRPDGASRGKSAPNGTPAGRWALGLFIGAVVGFPLLWGFMGAKEVILISGSLLIASLALAMMNLRKRAAKAAAVVSLVALCGLALIVVSNRVFSHSSGSKIPQHEIPEGYEGFVVMVYGFPGVMSQTFAENGSYQYIRYPDDGIVITSSEPRFGVAANRTLAEYNNSDQETFPKPSGWLRSEHWGSRVTRDGIRFNYMVMAVGSEAYWRSRNEDDIEPKLAEAEAKIRAHITDPRNKSAFTFNNLTPRPPRGPSEGGGKTTSYTSVKDAKLLAALSARYGAEESRFELGKPFGVDLLFLNRSPSDMVLNPQELPPTAWLTVTDSAGNMVKLTGTNEAASVLKEPRVLKSRDGTGGYAMSLLLLPKDNTAITPKAKADAMAWVEPGIYTLQFHLRLPVTGYPSEGSSEYHYHSTPLPIEIAGPPTKKTASKAPVSFGPMIERHIPRLAAEKACLLDLDTGEFHTPPADLVEQLKLNTTEKTDLKKSSLKWLRESGVDIAASPDLDTIYVIGSLTKGYHPPFDFNDMTPDLVADTFSKPSSIPKHKPDIYSAILPADLGPMVFITSEGTKGVVEIPSGTNDPAGVKIRYKLLRGSNPGSEAMAAAKAVLDLPPLEPVKELKIPQQDFPEGSGRMGYRLTVAPGKGAYVLATLREFEGTELIREKTPAKRQVARLLRTQSAAHSEDVFLNSYRDDVQTRTAASSRFAVSGFGQQVVITGLDFSGGGGGSVGGEKPVAVTRRFKFTDPGGDKARMRIVEFALRVLNEDDTAALAKRHGFSLPDENVDNWAITLAEPPAEPAAPATSAVDGPWGDHLKEGEIRRAQNGLADALVSYRLSLEVAQNEMKQRPQDAAWHAYSQRRIKKSYTRIGDVLCAQGDLTGALENYRAGLAGFEPLVRKEAADEELRNELAALHVKIGDVLQAPGDKAGALAAYRKAQEVEFEDFRTWEEEFVQSIGGSYNPTIPFQPEELRQHAANPQSEADFRRLAWLILRAGAEKDAGFRYLLDNKELRKDEKVNLALIAYDYSVNGNQKSLDDLLVRLAREKTRSDSSVAATLAFVDEWDQVPKAMDAHFVGADGSGGDLKGFCMAWRAYLFPRHSLQYEGKAGDGAPVKPR